MHPCRPRWKPPNQGGVKTNIDGAIFKDINAAGLRVVIWNDRGKVLAAMAEKIPIPNLVLTLEILAARRVVQFVHEVGISNSIFEGDSKISINALRKGQLLHSSFGHIIRDILFSTNSLQSFSFSHIYKQGHALAYALSKRAKFSSPLSVWMESIPLYLYNCYFSDFSVIE